MTSPNLPRVARLLTTVPALLFLLWIPIYWASSNVLKDSGVYVSDDVMFRADTKRAYHDMVGEREGRHHHTSGHPNYVIFHQPLGAALRAGQEMWDSKTLRRDSKKIASMLLSSTAGAGAVALLAALLLSIGMNRWTAALFACVLGFSTSHLIFASIPETYIFSALGLTSLGYLSANRDKSSRWWQLGAVYAASNLTTNLMNVGVWAMVRKWDVSSSFWLWIKRIAISVTASIALLIALNIVQRLIYPNTTLFFLPSAVAKESGWATLERLQNPVLHGSILLKHLFITNIVAPLPMIAKPFGIAMASIEEAGWPQMQSAAPLLGLWSAFLLLASAGLWQRDLRNPLVLGTVALLIFNAIFFLFFGHDRMLYTGLWTHLTVMLVAFGCHSATQVWPRLSKIQPWALAIFVCGQAINNWGFLHQVLAITKSS
jgi:hypothetical protein